MTTMKHAVTPQRPPAAPGGAQPTRNANSTSPTSVPEIDPVASEPSGKSTAGRFALYWFGIPLLVIIAGIILKTQCLGGA